MAKDVPHSGFGTFEIFLRRILDFIKLILRDWGRKELSSHHNNGRLFRTSTLAGFSSRRTPRDQGHCPGMGLELKRV